MHEKRHGDGKKKRRRKDALQGREDERHGKSKAEASSRAVIDGRNATQQSAAGWRSAFSKCPLDSLPRRSLFLSPFSFLRNPRFHIQFRFLSVLLLARSSLLLLLPVVAPAVNNSTRLLQKSRAMPVKSSLVGLGAWQGGVGVLGWSRHQSGDRDNPCVKVVYEMSSRWTHVSSCPAIHPRISHQTGRGSSTAPARGPGTHPHAPNESRWCCLLLRPIRMHSARSFLPP